MDETQLELVPEAPIVRPAFTPVDRINPPLRVAVIQDGTRLHYAVPIALQRAGALRLMFSEGFLPRGKASKLLRSVMRPVPSPKVRAMLQRRADEIQPELVRINPLLAARQELARRGFTSDESFYQWSSRAVGDWVLKNGIEDSNALFGFVRNIDPRLCREFRDCGILTIGDQMIAPAAIEAAEADLQLQRWPDWKFPGRVPDHKLVQEVEKSTWAELDCITCGSNYVADGLIQQGVSASKVQVVPYPIDAARYPTSLNKPQEPGDKPLTIGFIGTIGLRKGAPYFLEVAKRLKGHRFRFVMVGLVQLPDPIRKMMSEYVEFAGCVPGAEVVDWLLKFDMYLLPSTCEGSAVSATEAMATGLPIITSPNSGTGVRDGVEGFVRDYSDIDGMVNCIEQLAGDPKLRREMGIAGRAAAHGLSLEQYGRQLVQIITRARAATRR